MGRIVLLNTVLDDLGAQSNVALVEVTVNAQIAFTYSIDSTSSVWQWNNTVMGGGVAIVNVETIGTHTLNVWMHKDGFMLDKIVLITDPAYIPPAYIPTGNGPTESPISPN
ncbi:MAG: hypothetical protein GXP08_05680 [Gammaproteobacteria bacterium]|nr:hypothetical protein [Gammaproteobacteria bacterium]